ncbi:hypothetical protein RHMOL_Rhmol07G0319900 [Rhododendron molle]|uniref:Uncharacterized protein n=1 Tax=Rhododendron molle TaxID=49168 RepID=A0ACC0N6S5_RHOML|nr:hypothetical protein RHMOL_Rhmol07G0319900 [Rhododendron molle]
MKLSTRFTWKSFVTGSDHMEEDDAVTYYDNEPYDLLLQDMPVDGHDNLDWSRNDAIGTTIDALTFEAQLLEHSESDEDF